MSEVSLGSLINSPQQRDAVHVAVVPLIAGADLRAGQRFRLKWGTTDTAIPAPDDYEEAKEYAAIGIIDPFLEEWIIRAGQRVWGLLFPGTVTGMRHEWQHPAFAAVPIAMGAHERWLRQFCDRWGIPFADVLAIGTVASELHLLTAHGHDLHSAAELDDGEEAAFWAHLEGYTGKTFDTDQHRRVVWTCNC